MYDENWPFVLPGKSLTPGNVQVCDGRHTLTDWIGWQMLTGLELEKKQGRHQPLLSYKATETYLIHITAKSDSA